MPPTGHQYGGFFNCLKILGWQSGLGGGWWPTGPRPRPLLRLVLFCDARCRGPLQQATVSPGVPRWRALFSEHKVVRTAIDRWKVGYFGSLEYTKEMSFLGSLLPAKHVVELVPLPYMVGIAVEALGLCKGYHLLKES